MITYLFASKFYVKLYYIEAYGISHAINRFNNLLTKIYGTFKRYDKLYAISVVQSYDRKYSYDKHYYDYMYNLYLDAVKRHPGMENYLINNVYNDVKFYIDIKNELC